MLEAVIRKSLGTFQLDAQLTTGAGRVTALFGPSGAGKSSLASCLAGLIDPDQGKIVLDGTVLFDSESNTKLPPEKRRIGYVFQDARLFPHLTARQNLEYGLDRTKASERRVDFDHVVKLLALGPLLGRRPASLSGGEKQRVSFGRAVLTSPKLLIMDEPLASLDAARKSEILPFIERLRDELSIPIIYVSHAIEEILRLADDVIVLGHGSVMRAGPAIETLNSEAIIHGLEGDPGSVIEARVERHDVDDGLSMLSIGEKHLFVPLIAGRPGDMVRIRIRARDVALALERPTRISILNIISGRILEIDPGEDGHCDVRIDIGGGLWARITRRSAHEMELIKGQEVFALIKSVAIDRSSKE